MEPFAHPLPEELRRRIRRSSAPSWLNPMLPVPAFKVFSHREWHFEPKVPGERCLAFKVGETVRLLSKGRLPLDSRYPEIQEALAVVPGDFVLDGVVTALRNGEPDAGLSLLRQQASAADIPLREQAPVRLFAFDLPWISGWDLMRLPFRERRQELGRLLDSASEAVAPMPSRPSDGEEAFSDACSRGFTGVIAKRSSSAYQQHRSAEWLEFRCESRGEFLIGGFTEAERDRPGVSSLLLGRFERESFLYVGKVEASFDAETERRLRSRLEPMRRRSTPFRGRVPVSGLVYWVEPDLATEVAFEEWTGDRRLRKPRLIQVRSETHAETDAGSPPETEPEQIPEGLTKNRDRNSGA